MDNLIDYIQWMSDFPVRATGFRDADALVLCMLAYFDLAPLFRGDTENVYVRDCQRLIDAGEAEAEIVGKDMGYVDILQAAALSRRFGDLKITDYMDILREDPPLQFSAVCFHDDSDESFLAFRGTDSTLAGWREDFIAGFSHTEAQILARQYAETAVRTADRRWRMGGYSKGGNLALYTAVTMEAPSFSRIEKIYILDAPGLRAEALASDGFSRIDPKTVCIVPEFSVVGKLFEPPLSDRKIILSTTGGFMQHSPATWGIDHGKLALTNKNDPVSCWISDVLNRWAEHAARDEGLLFIREVFDALTAGGAATLEELASEMPEDFGRIAQRLQGVSETTKRILADLPKQAFLSSLPHPKHKKDMAE